MYTQGNVHKHCGGLALTACKYMSGARHAGFHERGMISQDDALLLCVSI